MACYHPLKAFRTSSGVSFSELSRDDHLGDLELPCGQCIGCRMRRASEWELRVMHEASLYERNCFVTLTYAPGKLPPYGSLHYADYQSFMRRLRKKRSTPVRFYMCGEYGDLNRRPHYHSCLFGVDFVDAVPAGKSAAGMVFYESAELTELWSHGKATVQPLVRETAGYCARYIMKKVLGESAGAHYTTIDADGVMHPIEPEFAHMSLKPGIGARWFDKYGSDVFPLDSVVVDGSERRVPRYYDKRFAKANAVLKEDIDYERLKRGKKCVADSTPERLSVREKVHTARVSKLARSM